MNRIDSEGAYRGIVTEAAVSATKNGFPQLVVRVQSTEKYIDSTNELQHYEMEEAGWLDWSEFEEDIIGYLCLANEDKTFANYDQVCKVFGWDGQSFAKLAEMDLEGTEVLIRVEPNTYNDETTLQVAWIDEKDAPVTRELSSLDAGKLKDLDSKFKTVLPKATKASKTAAKQKGGAKAKPKSEPKAKSGPPASKPAPPKAEAPAGGDCPFSDVASGACDDPKMFVWEYLSENKGEKSDAELTDFWMAACREIGGERNEEDFTHDDWVGIGRHVSKALNA